MFEHHILQDWYSTFCSTEQDRVLKPVLRVFNNCAVIRYVRVMTLSCKPCDVNLKMFINKL